MKDFKTREHMRKYQVAGVPSCVIIAMHMTIGLRGLLYLKRGSSVQASARMVVCNGAIPF